MNGGLSVDVAHAAGDFRLEAAFSAPAGVTALFGPSGAGKTMLVNIVSGLTRPTRGRVIVDGTVLVDTQAGFAVPSHRRRIGYVFQEGRLFPHLDVRQNLMFGRWFAPWAEPGPDLASVVDLLGIGHLLARRPKGLSGGEKQRVAIGRALLAKPRLLLMDEPLAALDEARKAEILPYLERLRGETGVPIVYVSHAVSEVARLADTLVVLEKGRVTACGATADVLGRLDLPSLSHAREAGAILEVRVQAHDAAFGLTTLASRAGLLQVPLIDLPRGAPLRIHIHARDVMLSLNRPEGLSALNILPGSVAEIAETGSGASVEIRLDCNGAVLLARLTRRSLHDLALAPGTQVFAIVKSVAFDNARYFPRRRSIVRRPAGAGSRPSLQGAASIRSRPESLAGRKSRLRIGRMRARRWLIRNRRRRRSANPRALPACCRHSRTSGCARSDRRSC